MQHGRCCCTTACSSSRLLLCFFFLCCYNLPPSTGGVVACVCVFVLFCTAHCSLKLLGSLQPSILVTPFCKGSGTSTIGFALVGVALARLPRSTANCIPGDRSCLVRVRSSDWRYSSTGEPVAGTCRATAPVSTLSSCECGIT